MTANTGTPHLAGVKPIERVTEQHYRWLVAIVNPMGMHARPASQFVELANRFPCEVALVKSGEEVDGKSILQLLSLSAEVGTELLLITNGPQAHEAIEALGQLINRGFNELSPD